MGYIYVVDIKGDSIIRILKIKSKKYIYFNIQYLAHIIIKKYIHILYIILYSINNTFNYKFNLKFILILITI